MPEIVTMLNRLKSVQHEQRGQCSTMGSSCDSDLGDVMAMCR